MYKVVKEFDEFDIRLPYKVEKFLNEQYSLGFELVTVYEGLFIFREICPEFLYSLSGEHKTRHQRASREKESPIFDLVGGGVSGLVGQTGMGKERGVVVWVDRGRAEDPGRT